MKSDIWLHRHNKKLWVFKWSREECAYIHTTRYGNRYKLFFDIKDSKPVWIGRLNRDGTAYYTVERKIDANFFVLFDHVVVSFK